MSEDLQFEIDFCRSVLNHDTENLTVMELLAGYLTKAGELDEGLAWDRKIVELDPNNAISHYNLACSLTLTRQHHAALEALRSALERGYNDFDWMLQDPT